MWGEYNLYEDLLPHENISRGQHSAIKPGKCTSIIRCTIHGLLVNIGPVINISRQVINISRQSQLCFRALPEKPEKMRLITFEVFSRALWERPENCDCIKIVQKILNNTSTAWRTVIKNVHAIGFQKQYRRQEKKNKMTFVKTRLI